MRYVLLALLLLSSALPAYAGDGPVLLRSVDAIPADDGSVELTLEFSGGMPDVRVIRSGERLVHLVLVGAQLPPNRRFAVHPAGEIRSGVFNGFAGIGMRLDLALRDPSPHITVQSFGHSDAVVVHIPAPHSDNEALLTSSHRSGSQETAFIPLSYADVSEVAGILVKGAAVPSLDSFYPQSPFAAPTPDSRSMSSSDRGGSQRAPTYVTIPASAILNNRDAPTGVKLDDHISIDRRLNALIVTGTPEEVANIRHIVSYVDVPARSVLLETQIVELTQSAARSLGIDYSHDGTLATATFGAATNNRVGGTLSVQAQINALESTGQAKLLAQPRILALNARPAAILSGEAVPIVNTVLVPSGGQPLVEQQVQYINVGVSLEILPRISADGRVTTQVFSEVSSIIDYVQNAPRIAVRQGLASGIVRDGESLVVGGLLQENEISQMRKVPGLGNLPLIGGFFRSTTTSKQTTNLYLVITPHVLSNKG